MVFCFLFVLVGCIESIIVTPSSLNGIAIVTATPTDIYLPIVTRSPVFKTVLPVELTDGYIPNPYMGWQNTRNTPQSFPSTIHYARFNWQDINPAENVYDWGPIEILRQEGLALDQKIHFRIRNAQPPPWGPGQVIPDWVIAQGAVIIDGSRGTEPLYSDCQFLTFQAVFVDAFRQQYDGDPDIAFLDIGAYGNFGEWGTEQYDETPGSLDWHARRRLADMYLGGQGTRPCQQADGSVIDVSYNYTGFQQTQLLMPYTPWRKDSLFYATDARSDVGIRHDALGSETHQNKYREEIGDLVARSWRNVPIVFEFSSDANSSTALASARAFAQEMHASLIHENFNGYDAGIAAVLEVIGYRLVLREITYVRELTTDYPLTVNMIWENTSSAPPYHAYHLMAALVDNQDTVVWEQEIDTDVRTWTPRTAISVQDDLILPDTLPVGLYDLRIAFVDDNTHQPVLNLAIAGRDSNGRYQIGPVQIIDEPQ